MMTFTGENIWVIGASSGIGKALCEQLASHGATLLLSARRLEELEKLNQHLGGQHHVYPLDVANAEAVKKVSQDIVHSVKNIDRVIFMAAIYQPKLIKDIDLKFVKQLSEVNFLGAINCTHSVLSILSKQKYGQLVLCASSAGYLGLAGGQPYSATKAALINFAQSLYVEVEKSIDIKIINSGFVKTPMTDKNEFSMPMCIEVEDAAKAILKGLNKRAFEIHFPKRFTFLMKFIALLPYTLQFWVTRKLKH